MSDWKGSTVLLRKEWRHDTVQRCAFEPSRDPDPRVHVHANDVKHTHPGLGTDGQLVRAGRC